MVWEENLVEAFGEDYWLLSVERGDDMFYASDLATLVSIWVARMNNPGLPDAYRDALSDCIYEFNQFIDKGVSDETNALSATTLQEIESHEACINQTSGR